LINIKGEDSIAAVAKVMNDDEDIEDVSDIDVTVENNDE
jgi:DNA gyrase subunit A